MEVTTEAAAGKKRASGNDRKRKGRGNDAGTKKLQSFNPATGELVGEVTTVKAGQVQGIVDEVAEVQPFWASLRPEDRGRYLQRAAQVILDEIDDLAELLTREQGKPRTESYSMELTPTIDVLNWCAKYGPEILADEPISYPQIYLKQKKSFFCYEPLGVVGIIAPWNYPWSIPLGEIAMALMAGNGVIFKPATLTCVVGQRIQETFEKAGLPQGILRTVHGSGIGPAIIEASTAKIFFTGSVEVGRNVGEACARLMKGSVLELGGKDPQIVCADAPLPHAISGGVWAGFANAGQSCTGIERVYVMREVADRYIRGAVEETRRLRVGDPTSPDISIGPMISKEQYGVVKDLVDDAVSSGATMHCGGPVDTGMPGHFYAPTVLTDVTHNMRIMKEEIFGPVLPIVTVDSEEEAIRLANDSDFGLGASIWTLDRDKGTRMAHQIESGMVWINDHSYSHGACQCSWGGVKDSGLGRSHSKFGFYECVNIKHIAWEPSRVRNLWWHPYDKSLRQALKASAKLLYSKRGGRAQALREGAWPLIKVTRRTMKDTFRRNGPRPS